MATPLHDALSVRLSREIGDAVSSASSDGVVWSSTQRDGFLNEAYRRLIRKFIAARNWSALRSYIATEAQSLASNVLALSSWTGGVDTIISAYNATDSVIINPADSALKEELDSGINQFLLADSTQQRYTVNGGQFRLHGGTSTSSVRLTYVKPHTDISAAGAAGTVVYDAAWTATSTAITNFTGVIAGHVGGTFVGTDSGGNLFHRTIVAYVSSTAFTINAALTADGAGTLGYIIPPGSSDTLIPSQYWHDVIDMAVAVAMENDPSESVNLTRATLKQAAVDKEIAS